MKARIKQLLILGLSFFFFSFVLFFITVPKFLLLDRLLLKNNLYLLADGVEEKIFSVQLKKVQVYGKNSKLGEFIELKLALRPFYLLLSGKCAEGSFQIRIFPSKSFDAEGKNLDCLKQAHIKSMNLQVGDGIRGSLELKTLKVKDFSVDELSLNFKGNVFSGQAKMANLVFLGDGIVSFNRENPLKSSINGKLVGTGMTLLISGSLENPSVEFVR